MQIEIVRKDIVSLRDETRDKKLLAGTCAGVRNQEQERSPERTTHEKRNAESIYLMTSWSYDRHRHEATVATVLYCSNAS